MERDGAWLANGDYAQSVRSLCFSDPRLKQRDPKAQTQRVPFADDGVRVVKLGLKNGAFAREAEFDDPAALDVHLLAAASPAVTAARRSIYVVEGLGPGFAGVLGSRFGLHPSLFVEHERVVVHNLNGAGESDGVQLPSVVRGRGHLEMKYYEVVEFDRKPTSFRWVCAATGRHIGVSRDFRWDNSPDEVANYLNVGVVRRKCGVWSRRTEGGGWDCLVLCDPPVKSVRTGVDYKIEYPVKTRAYQGGYLDFVPEEEQMRVAREGRYRGPPRASMLEDLSFYLETHSGLVDTAEPDAAVGVFVKKIVASHFLKQTEHLRATLSAVQRGLTRKQDLAKMPMAKVEALWSDMQGWERRTGEYLEDLEGIMLQLGIPLSNPAPVADVADAAANAAWRDCAADFQFLHLRFRELRHRTETLNAAVTGLAGITGNRQAYKEQQRSIREAKSTKAVTLLGLVFIPLAYTSSLFGMEVPYGPGGEFFWIYFVTSAPLILVVLLGYYVLDFGYDDDGRAWSVVTFNKSMDERLGWFKRHNTEKRLFG
ncbi:Putative corA, transmembrane region [Colletotrichum destructivum]|uniref:CorA, transmembrane region n=1 Tax=Colletotrichum destructivum TaxID=34406 RepID=A0AAX4J0I1_9PEZI|nr:Putative corA, transmembrane region [Colletotrichum destructivum]